jgi:hypothetical protein
MDKSEFNDQQIEHLIQSSLFNDAAQVSPENGTFFAIQDRLGDQKGPGMQQRLTDSLEDLSEAIWRIIPVSKQRMAQALVVVAIAVAVGSYVAFAGTDGAVDSSSAAEATAAAEPAVPVATPIAKLTVPNDLAPFDELKPIPVDSQLSAGGMLLAEGQTAILGQLAWNTPIEKEIIAREKMLKDWVFGAKRMLLLIYAPGEDPLSDGTPWIPDFENSGVGQTTLGTWALSQEDPRVIIVEEFAFCDDGRGVYLQHSAKPVEVGETFAWDVYVTPKDASGDFHLVLTAESDSPITHDGPDPKKLDLVLSAGNDVGSTDLGVKLVGMFARDDAVIEMCNN